MLGMLKKLISKILGIDDGGVCYVGGGETLPTPLTPAEESRALGEMGQGGRRCGAPGRHARCYSGRPLRLRMDSPSIWMV